MTQSYPISGLTYIPDWLTQERAFGLVKFIDDQAWDTSLKRRTQQYGYRYNYHQRTTASSNVKPISEPFESLCKAVEQCTLDAAPFNQIIVNEYLQGQGISAHIDSIKDFGPTVISLSLVGSAIMKFDEIGSGRVEEIWLAPRSLLMLSGEARSAWRHCIPARKSDMIDNQRVLRDRRISLTFRTKI